MVLSSFEFNQNVIGVLAIRKKKSGLEFTFDDKSYLDSFIAISAIAISRALSWSSTMDFLIKSI